MVGNIIKGLCDLEMVKFILSIKKNERLVTQMVKNLPAVQETRVQSLGWEDALEKGMATHSSILAWRTPWTEEPRGLQSLGLQIVFHYIYPAYSLSSHLLMDI